MGEDRAMRCAHEEDLPWVGIARRHDPDMEIAKRDQNRRDGGFIPISHVSMVIEVRGVQYPPHVVWVLRIRLFVSDSVFQQ